MVYRAGTVVSRNYLAMAGLVFRSFSEHNPDVEFTTLILDGLEEDRQMDGVGRVMLVSDVDIAPSLLHQMTAMYSVMDLSCAFKSVLLRHLLDEGSDAALWVDSDFWFYADVHDALAEAVEHGVVLTPNVVHPYPRDGRQISEIELARAGVFGGGFIVVGQSGRAFVDWWFERMTTDEPSRVSCRFLSLKGFGYAQQISPRGS